MAENPLTSPDVWNELHQAYDKTLGGLFSAAAKRGIELIAPDRDAEVLDVACGPGTLTLNVAPLVRKVVAVDFAASMLELLEEKRRVAKIRNIEALVGDGTALPFADARFDAAFSCFGLFLFADRAKGFAEGPVEETYRILREVLPDLPFGAGHSPLGTREDIVAEMSAASFVDINVEKLPIHFSFPSTDAFWAENALASAPFVAARRRVAARDWPAVEARVVASLRSSFPGPVAFDRWAWVAVGRRAAARA